LPRCCNGHEADGVSSRRKVLWMKSRGIWLSAMALVFALLGGLEARAAAVDNVPQSEPLGTAGSLQPSSVWVVVNLFTGRSSKQAVIVRDKLMRLGAGGQGIILPFSEITVENMVKLRPAFLALSPNGVPWCKYKGKNHVDLMNFFQALKVLVEDMDIPVIGICGGHQALALAFGGKVGPIRGGEDDCFPYGHNPTERGRHNVEVVEKDPLFAGMGDSINLVQNHYDEVKRLPPGFVCLAKNRLCPYQIIKHPTKPAYGVQAHTEYWMATRPDGGTLLRNFLNIARTRYEQAQPTSGTDDKPAVPRGRKSAGTSGGEM
jgi:GMP synthase (glutamine-hydrolysing)